jgi:hypothetical protein
VDKHGGGKYLLGKCAKRTVLELFYLETILTQGFRKYRKIHKPVIIYQILQVCLDSIDAPVSETTGYFTLNAGADPGNWQIVAFLVSPAVDSGTLLSVSLYLTRIVPLPLGIVDKMRDIAR